DIHAQPLPAGSYTENYRPGAVGPEMPPTFNGSRADRVEQARIYSDRADAVADKTRNLLALEAEQAYLKDVEAAAKVAKYDLAVKDAEAAAKVVRKRFSPVDEKMAVSLEQVLSASVLQSQIRAWANEARYQQLLALAQLERVTACGFVAGFDTAPEVP